MNYFQYDAAAERYAKCRPFIHAKAIDSFKKFAKFDTTFKRCLDVGCGTGMSSVAVAEICDEVLGIDISDGMLAQAIGHPKIKYQQSGAEKLPFDDDSFELVSVGLAMHWFDQPAFLKEAHRVLQSEGWLVSYHNEFSRGMVGVPKFKMWFDSEYLNRYPNPPRKNALAFDEKIAEGLFDYQGKEQFFNEVPLKQEQLIAYLVSQSNIIAKVEQGSEDLNEITNWLTNSTIQFFKNNNPRVFLFDGEIWYLRKLS